MNNSNCYNVETSKEIYNPVALIFHDYPNEFILNKVRGKEKTINEYTRIINKLKKKILFHIIKKERELGVSNTGEEKIVKLDDRIERLRMVISEDTAKHLFFNETIISWNENDKQIEKSYEMHKKQKRLQKK